MKLITSKFPHRKMSTEKLYIINMEEDKSIDMTIRF